MHRCAMERVRGTDNPVEKRLPVRIVIKNIAEVILFERVDVCNRRLLQLLKTRDVHSQRKQKVDRALLLGISRIYIPSGKFHDDVVW